MMEPLFCVIPLTANKLRVAACAPVLLKLRAVPMVMLPAPLAPTVGLAVLMVTLVPLLIAVSIVDFKTSLALMPVVS